MFKRLMACLTLTCMTLLTGCGSEVVEPGFVGVLVKNPYLFGDNGVDSQVYTEGRHYIALSSNMVMYSTQPRQQEESFNDISTVNSTPVDFKAIIRYQIIPEKANELHPRFGQNFYETNLKKDFQNMLRDFARSHTVKELTTQQTVTDDGERQVYNRMVAIIKEKQIPITIMAVTIGAIMPPEEVLAETARTEAQTQRALTETSRALAEAKRADAESKKAIADKAYMSEMNMTPAEYLTSRRIEIEKEMVDSVKGNKNVNILFTIGGQQPGVTVPQPVKP